MWLLFGYLATSILTMAGLSFQRGHKDAQRNGEYVPDDFFIPLGVGLVWPITIPTYLMYKVGYSTFKHQEAKRDEQQRIANDKHRQERIREMELAEGLKEVDKLLETGKN